jgi:hypothetical protein
MHQPETASYTTLYEEINFKMHSDFKGNAQTVYKQMDVEDECLLG